MERQTVRVADFLRRSPYVGLTLTSVTTPEDVEALKTREVAAKLDFFQKEKKIGDRARAIRRYYEANFKDVPVPPTESEQIAWLRQREPEPIGPLEDLRRRRLEVTRDRLVKVEGIPEARLQTQEAGAPTAGAPPGTGSAPASGGAAAPGAASGGTLTPAAPPSGGASTPSGAPAPSEPAPGAAPSSGATPAAGGAAASGKAAAEGSAPPAVAAAPGAPSSGEAASGTTGAAESGAKAQAGGRVEFGIVGESD
jgi:hypothetical protein